MFLLGLLAGAALGASVTRVRGSSGAAHGTALASSSGDAAPLQATLADFLAAVAAPNPTPGGGSVAACAGALAAALTEMVAGVAARRRAHADDEAAMITTVRRAAALGAELRELVERDAAAYGAVVAAYRLPSAPVEAASARAAAVEEALLEATRVPVATACAAAEVASLAAWVAEHGNRSAAADAAVAALLAEAVCQGSALNVRVNIASLADPRLGEPLADGATVHVATAARAAAQAVAAVGRRR